MREFLKRHRSKIITFVALAIPLFLLYVHGRRVGPRADDRKTTFIEYALRKVTAPAQSAASKLIKGIEDLWNDYMALIDVEEENEDLRDQNKRLTAEALTGKQLLVENQMLRRELDFKRKRSDLRLVAAHVIGKDVSPYARVVRVEIDVGSEDAIREGMPVVTELGLVGRTRQVGGRHADVMLAIDPKFSVNVKVAGKGVTGTLEGTGRGKSYSARLLLLEKSAPLEKNDTLVTSGHDKVFPPNIEVGYILEDEERQSGLFYELQVAPAVNFSVLEVVQVVVGKAPARPPEEEKQEEQKGAPKKADEAKAASDGGRP